MPATVSVHLQRTGSDSRYGPYGDGQQWDRASLEWNGAYMRLRASNVTQPPLFFSSPFRDIREETLVLARLAAAVVGVPVRVLRVVATPLAVRRRRASRRV